MWKLLVALAILSLHCGVAMDLDDEINSELSLLFEEKPAFEYKEPNWWGRVASDGKKDNKRIKRCFKRETIPYEGESCSRREKHCYFGNQTCAGEDHPSTLCACTGGSKTTPGTWSCEAKSCPTCPAEDPSEEDTNIPCTGEMKCNYGKVKCCGIPHPEVQCTCGDDGFLTCGMVEGCMLPECLFENIDVEGLLCEEEAISVVKEVYPGMEVVCATSLPDIDDVPDSEFDKNRMTIVMDKDGVATRNPKLG